MSLALRTVDAETGIATITVNRPEVRNALDVPTARAICDAVLPLREMPDIRCVVLRGAGGAFIAGGDLARFADDFDQAASVVHGLLDALHPAILTLRALNAPVLGVVHGAVAGAGLSLMSGCDLVVAARGTRFVLAYDRVGAAPDCGGTWFLPRLLGPRRAAELMMLSPTWDADQAQAYGLINRVVDADQLDAEAARLAAQLARGPTVAYGKFKRLADASLSSDLGAQLEAERAAFASGTRTADFREGVTAFLAKRPATFTGH
ncbi:MAG: enoyl-CoA hydratase-related protein [Polycyclovorans sp.]|jgi:2-(1,2-epoxy-1,2-dihydrophenyl)acetyl-CoA isomerase|nr:enoyl-CoA hydratase [Polycyclovorans sp.]MDP1543270.1 enoyl-CoA hydratase-related protein [Polycyclovorans sp.]MEC8849715.1 enoyl-CoA hydratase-related protein [Pseudomonadota bacterium]|tara:strand:+ start:45354 stop:46142 length:789 start_codon:yes stop_codon:yes gene_type:complete